MRISDCASILFVAHAQSCRGYVLTATTRNVVMPLAVPKVALEN